MGIFRNKPDGGIMDVIRCDEPTFLIWKWHPSGVSEGEASRENSIRWGSSLRVKTGEMAIFVYHSDGKLIQDYIVGPFDSILETDNLPIISSAIGRLYNGGTPFQAEVYFVNLAQSLQIKIGVQQFGVSDPRFPDHGVPTSVRGVINFKITDYKEFIEKFQLRTISLDDFKGIIKAAAIKYVKATVTNAPDEYDIPVTQLEKRILEINDIVEKYLKRRLFEEFGVSVTSVDISDIEIDKTSSDYKFLIKKSNVGINLGVASQIRGFATDTAAQVSELATDRAVAKADVEEYQYAKRKKTQLGFVKGFIRSGAGDLSDSEKRPGFTTNITKGVTGMVSGIGSKLSKGSKEQVPPPLPSCNYHVAVNGNAVGPLDYNGLTELVAQGTLTPESFVWKKGMKDWVKAGSVDDLSSLFEVNDDEMPPIPPAL